MATLNMTGASALFKTKYVRLSRDMFNSENIVQAKIKRNDNFVGDQALVSVPTSFGGGVGSGSIPKANPATYNKMLMTSKKLYATIEVDREAIKAADNDEGAFVRATKEQVKRGVQAWQRNLSRVIFNNSLASNGNGRLGSFSGNQTLVSAGVYDVVVTTATWKQANFEPKDYVSINSSSALYEITAVTPSTKTIRLSLNEGADVGLSTIGAGTHNIYMQGSKDNDPTGFSGVVRASSGSVFGITVGYRWQSPSQIDASSAGITPDDLNKQFLDIKYAFGESPDMFVGSFVQYRKLLNQLEDQKRYMIVQSRESGPNGKFSFQALEYMTDSGPVPIIAERFVEDDAIYSINSDFIEIHARPDGGWVDDDLSGSIFLRTERDTFEARYAVYLEVATMPTAHGVIYNLAS